MPAYLIADVDVHDPARYGDYRAQVPDSIAGYGGRFVVRAGASEVLEGDWRPGRLVVIEFPDMERARAWYESDDYQALKAIRDEASTGKILFVEGYEGD